MAAPASITAVPEVGQVVNVRQRRFVVADVLSSTLPPDPLRGRTSAPQHLLTLNAIDDEGSGEELKVIWEIEPGARIIDKKSDLPAPTGFDAPSRLDAFLDAVRWGASSNADVRSIQSPFRSGIEIEDYQLDPVVRAVQMPRANLLIADDVGLGKTIETGLVLLELVLRHRARTALIVCPSSLQIQWQDQMRDKFGLDFVIVDAKCLADLRRRRGLHVNPWTHFPRLITSIDFLKRDRPMRLFRDALAGRPAFPRRFDVLIVDEAHNVAPSGRGRISIDSMRTNAIRTLAPHFEHKLFLSATPHNGYLDSFSALLELLDNQRFRRGVEPPRAQLETVMVRRLKSEIKDFDGRPKFPERNLDHPIEVQYPDHERRIHALLRKYTGMRQDGAVDALERCATEFVLKLLKKRLFSSPASFASTLSAHVRSLTSARRRGAIAGLNTSRLQREFDRAEEEFGDDTEFEQVTTDVLDTASRVFRELSSEERSIVREMQEWAEQARSRPDAKAQALFAWLREHIKPNGAWSDNRVIVFTEYRDTQNWLKGILTSEQLADADRLMMLYGGMKPEDRERIKAAFQFDPAQSPVRILLATDAASEGIDLQNHCSRLIHYEIPWNPARLEQRNGRIDRHGQRAPRVYVHHFVGKGYKRDVLGVSKPGELEGDLEFLMHAAFKVDQIRHDLGKVGPVIASQVEQAMLGQRTRLDTALAEKDAEPARRMLTFERDVRKRIADLREQLQETRQEWRLEPENIRAVVETALELAGQPKLIPVDVEGASPAYRMPQFTAPSWRLCTQGLVHPHTGAIRPIVFHHSLAAGRDDVVLVHMNHRLVRMSLALLRAEVWTHDQNRQLYRVTARRVPDGVLDAPAVVAHGRIVVVGGRGDRLHEEVIAAGGRIREGRFARMNVGEIATALKAALETSPPASVTERLAALWPQISGPLRTSLDARMNDLTEGLAKRLGERAEKEKSDLRAILTELRTSIERELKDPEWQQLTLYPDLERQQAERNLDGLRERLLQIPEELERETAAITARYADFHPRLFPVSVTWLVPERFARG